VWRPTPTCPNNRSEDVPAGRTLFVSNPPIRPGLDVARYLREAFTP
jgi:hypothetical protein